MSTIPTQSRATGQLLLVMLALITVLSGCTAPPKPLCSPADGLVLVVGVHQNIQAPGVPDALRCVLETTIGAGEPVSVIAVDSTPSVALSATYKVTDANPTARQDDISRAVNEVLAKVKGAKPDSAGSDLLTGVAMGADNARAQGAPHARIVIIDSGYPDTGSLDMTVPGMLGANPQEVATFLTNEKDLFDLTGFEGVDLVGFGYSSAPQKPISQAGRTATIALFTAILSRAHAAKVTIIPVVRTGTGPKTRFTTRTVPVVASVTPPVCGGSATFDDTTALGFDEKGSVLRDPAGAASALAPLARSLRKNPACIAHITGTTSSTGTFRGNLSLSVLRALATKDILTRLGVGAGQMTTSGAGYTANPPDRDAHDVLNPAAAARNRTVQITTTAP